MAAMAAMATTTTTTTTKTTATASGQNEDEKLTTAARVARAGRGVYVTTQFGFERVAAEELEATLGKPRAELLEDKGFVFAALDSFDCLTQEAASKLRSVENAYALVTAVRIAGLAQMPKEEALDALRRAAAETDPACWEAAKEAAWRVRGVSVKESARGAKFRIFRKRFGKPKHQFTSTDIGLPVFKGLDLLLPDWEGVLEDPNVSIMARVSDDILFLGVKLTDELVWSNLLLPYERERVLTPLRPSAAHAMAVLSRPQPAEIFIDPMAGCGTIPEVAAHSYAGQLFCISGEKDPLSVQKARRNADASPMHAYLDVVQWDARRLPLREGVVHRAACDLPFGKKCGSRKQNKTLYVDLVKELDRTMVRGGAAVLLSGDLRNIESCNPPGKTCTSEQWRAQCGGLDVTIKIIHKRETPVVCDDADS
ncbi:THUMP domain-containing protein 3 [Hondaea fermentalgiana]|uniref:THUMP domain-containing protein 3 n=1 Tax=Hondaea fermentalgiana TaxID=2315210 RepID=A0A2R5GWP7_9STRA|nr:THUMP domain-containing protein 3 [Hondaea fermentalgiana]|eukprot:GBG34198.1 THUMP domain-containing protein 3 [Hondaea fermentalgiana]